MQSVDGRIALTNIAEAGLLDFLQPERGMVNGQDMVDLRVKMSCFEIIDAVTVDYVNSFITSPSCTQTNQNPPEPRLVCRCPWRTFPGTHR